MIKKTAVVLSLSFLASSPVASSASSEQCLAYWAEDMYNCTAQYSYEMSFIGTMQYAQARFLRCWSLADFNYSSCSLYAD